MTWTAHGPPGDKGARYHLHPSGIRVAHCGHPTANRPYYVQDLQGRWVGWMDRSTRKGRPMGLVFRRLAEAKAWVEAHLWPAIEFDDETWELLHTWCWRLPSDWADHFDWPVTATGNHGASET